MIGWDEIAHSSLVPGAVVQYWKVEENAAKGIAQGAKILVSPATRTYLDMQYDSTTHLGLHWAAYIEVDDAYNWDPTTMSPVIKKEHIEGVESPLWTETITTIDELEYMVFPRLLCNAEVGWTAMEDRNWDDFKMRLAKFGPRLDALEIDYYPSQKIDWKK